MNLSLTDTGRRLVWWGLLQFMLGIASGAVAGIMENPRGGLAAHLGGTSQGMAMMLFGLLWACVLLGDSWRRLAYFGQIVGNLGIWLALQLAALFGTGRITPFSGAGYTGAPWQEALVSTVMVIGVIAASLSFALLFTGLTRGLRAPAPAR